MRAVGFACPMPYLVSFCFMLQLLKKKKRKYSQGPSLVVSPPPMAHPSKQALLLVPCPVILQWVLVPVPDTRCKSNSNQVTYVFVVEVLEQLDLAEGAQAKHGVVEWGDLFDGNFLSSGSVNCRASMDTEKTSTRWEGKLVFGDTHWVLSFHLHALQREMSW